MTAPTSRRGRRIAENRELIATELDKTLIVEAACRHRQDHRARRPHRRADPEPSAPRFGQIVAVTFSEKAAGELKLRLREELERSRAKAAPNSAGERAPR
jgi:hypothetical protein